MEERRKRTQQWIWKSREIEDKEEKNGSGGVMVKMKMKMMMMMTIDDGDEQRTDLEGHHVEEGDFPSRRRHDIGIIFGKRNARSGLLRAALTLVICHCHPICWLPQLRHSHWS